MTEAGDVARRTGILMCLVGPAGSGKSSLAQRLMMLEKTGMRKSVSVTSRPPRPGEIDGTSYHFVDRDQFERRVKQGEFFEWEEVHGNLYGQLRQPLERAISEAVDVLLDIDIRGAISVKKAFPGNAVVVFLVPPSAAVLKERLLARGAISEAELKRRLETAIGEYSRLLSVWREGSNYVDFLVVNDQFDGTVDALHSILKSERCRLSRLDRVQVGALCSLGT